MSSLSLQDLPCDHAGFLYGGRTWYLFTWSFLDRQCAARRLSSTSPVFDSRTPYSSSLLTSLGMGLCQWLSHQAGGRSGVRAHWCGWRRQLRGPAYLFQTWPQPTCVESPSTNRLLWMLLRNVKLAPEGSWPDHTRKGQPDLGWSLKTRNWTECRKSGQVQCLNTRDLYHVCLLQPVLQWVERRSCDPHDDVLQWPLRIWPVQLGRNQQMPPTLELIPSLLIENPKAGRGKVFSSGNKMHNFMDARVYTQHSSNALC